MDKKIPARLAMRNTSMSRGKDAVHLSRDSLLFARQQMPAAGWGEELLHPRTPPVAAVGATDRRRLPQEEASAVDHLHRPRSPAWTAGRPHRRLGAVAAMGLLHPQR